ncbi:MULTISPECIES: class I SAM-dependent methyltransferase [unclassified Arsukibacterium]|uniref:class I SAM-dependent methyltransferase n=1 Tax=unclassified Arsukibacterium TaxID=2635278 RepID=UPI000C3BC6FF|nr:MULTISPECIES: class I SAM-dependent methyltransferase [unclassified Arsukibacterium]MAA96382.1 DNA polymerase I [Rheinheimera sp.]MBM33107.1 DNA polymerase I [Rheinheimera sp.]HAW92049.1 DNA polymerase I [Candidatus Azambacteria bacterium]|tara:strand:- start:6004 stop:6756 length:753 start_codon:yes stop_codon:yes gene_type:complete
MSSILLLQSAGLSADYSQQLQQQFGLQLTTEPDGWYLSMQQGALVLLNSRLPKQGAVLVDFSSGASSYRRQHGGGKSEAIAKAVGLHKKRDLQVLDATAGLGRDAFVLASLGATVTLVERNPAVAALLADGLRRAVADPMLSSVAGRMQLCHCPAIQALKNSAAVDVVFLDPMFPAREKSAQVKKEMRAFHDVVGSDHDADNLLAPAWQLAEKRVVVKRPGYADYLAGQQPTMSISGKNNRFDVYVKAAI